MSARGVRALWIVVSSILLIGGGLAACFGGGLFAVSRSHEAIFSPHGVDHWWHEGHWVSLLVVALIGLILAVVGGDLARRQLRGHPRGDRLDDLALSANGAPGVTVVHTAALRHGLEADLERQADLKDAHIGLYGSPGALSLEGQITATETASIDGIVRHFDCALARWRATTGLSPAGGTIVLTYTGRHQPPRVT